MGRAALLIGLIWPGLAAAQSVGALAEYMDVLGAIALEESDSVLTVNPVVAVDPSGGFIVADPRDAQVRLYDERGRLMRLVATRGSGPGEVQVPLAAVRKPAGHLLVADVGQSAILEFDESGAREIRRYPTPFQIVRLLDLEDRVLVVGAAPPSRTASATLLLHTWSDGSIGASFFPRPATRASPQDPRPDPVLDRAGIGSAGSTRLPDPTTVGGGIHPDLGRLRLGRHHPRPVQSSPGW